MISKSNNYLLYFKIFSKQLLFNAHLVIQALIVYCNLLFVPHTENIFFCYEFCLG